MDKYKYVKISIFVVDIFFVVLTALAVGLPFLITKYVEVMNRRASLATTVMLTSYPCLPFVTFGMISLRRFLKGVMEGEIFAPNNLKNLKLLTFCCAVISIITLIAGFFYMPFYFVGLAFGFMALLVFCLFNIGKTANMD